MNDIPVLTTLPHRTDQNPEVLADESGIAEKLTQLFFNSRNEIAFQVKGEKGLWGYQKWATDAGSVPGHVREHLGGRKTCGFYAYGQAKTSKWLCIDIDLKEHVLDPASESIVLEALQVCNQRLDALDVPTQSRLIEFSGGKGVHIWILLGETPTNDARRFWNLFSRDLVLPAFIALDLYPHPNTDPAQNEYGQLVKLPLGRHQKIGRFSCLIDGDGREMMSALPVLQALQPWALPSGLPELNEKAKPKSKRKPKRSRARKVVSILPPVDVPRFTHPYRKLIEGCLFLRSFHDHPELASYHEWKHAGLVLTHLGEDGEAWFEHLSSKDTARYDGSHRDVIDAVKNRGYRFPNCQTIGCDQCSRDCPIQILHKPRPNLSFLPGDKPVLPSMTLDQLQVELRNQLEQAINDCISKKKD
jgi:hypothetical protein